MNYKEFLYNKDNVLSFSPELAIILNKFEESNARKEKKKTGKYKKPYGNGLNKAIFINQLNYWLDINEKAEKNFKDGYYWVYNTYENWVENDFPYWSIDTVKRIIGSLENTGIIISENYNKMRADKTKWYRIDYKRLQEIIDMVPESERETSRYKKDISTEKNEYKYDRAECTDEQGNMSKTIPEITTEITGIINTTTKNIHNIIISPFKSSPFIPLTEEPKEEDKQNTQMDTNANNQHTEYVNNKPSVQKKKRPPYNYTFSQIKDFLHWKIPELMKDVFPSEPESHVNFVADTITWFYGRYMISEGKRQPIFSDNTYLKIADKLLHPIDEIKTLGKQFCAQFYAKMIDIFFQTNYGEVSGNTTDYHMSYFLLPIIQERLCTKIQYPCDTDSPSWEEYDDFIRRKRAEYAREQGFIYQPT